MAAQRLAALGIPRRVQSVVQCMEAIKRGEKPRPRKNFASQYPFADPCNGNQRAIVSCRRWSSVHWTHDVKRKSQVFRLAARIVLFLSDSYFGTAPMILVAQFATLSLSSSCTSILMRPCAETVLRGIGNPICCPHVY